MSGSVSSFEAVVSWIAPTTSSFESPSTKWCVSIGAGSAGACTTGGLTGTTTCGGAIGCEPISAQPASRLASAASAAVGRRSWSRDRRTALILEEYGLIGQLVALGARGRKVLAQQPRNAGYRGTGTLEVPARAGVLLDLAAHALPLRLADLRADTAVGDDLDRAVGPQHVDQHTVVMLGVPDVELREHGQRALPRRDAAPQPVPGQRGLDHEADLARVLLLRGPDGRFDLALHLGCEQRSRAPRAA